ncbi:protein of unknown function [Moritella yayanosii]|uniref:Uncharacterized protein n=1 Tax=Moritella yayanosii TaxID=69539 RepID=A0A330LRB2_9GAMM|nr:protein of unknown function [Moritella yayanosii]
MLKSLNLHMTIIMSLVMQRSTQQERFNRVKNKVNFSSLERHKS